MTIIFISAGITLAVLISLVCAVAMVSKTGTGRMVYKTEDGEVTVENVPVGFEQGPEA